MGELGEERLAARAAVEQLRLTPIMFELGARPHPPRVLYRSYLAQSDVFVGIYWQRYGWVAPDMDISGLEDELLLSDGMPRLIYVKRPAPDMEPRLADVLERLEGEGSASYKPFRDTGELHDLLLDDLAVLLTERFEPSRPPATPERRRSNLPAPTSTFFGRETALESLAALIEDPSTRLITLTGPGGTGKTRLALEVARANAHRFADGVFFVDLSAEREPDEVFEAIARVLRIGGDAEGSALDALQRDLRDRQVLLVLDNFEQALPASTGVAHLLGGCPDLQVLATSRESLHVSAERVFAVAPLTVPDADPDGASADAVLASEAGRLFQDRAEASGSSFVVTDENAGDLVAIVRRLDGLPLAVELAAARMKVFGIDELREQLDQRRELLTGGARDLPARQQTLRSTIEWSYDLLDEDERTVLALFSVFSDARLVHVDAVVRRAPPVAGVDVVESLSSLVDKSLALVIEGNDRRPRFSLLQTIRRFAAEQLDATPELEEAIRQAHAEVYTELALELHRRLTYADRNGVLSALGADLANLRTAWDHWVRRADVTHLGEMLAPVWGYFDARGDYRTAIVLGEELLRILSELPDTAERRYNEFAVQTNLARTHLVVRGFTHEAERTMRDALARFEAVGQDRQRFPALRSLASLHLMRSEFGQMSAVTDDLMAIAEHEGDPALLSEAHMLACVQSGWERDLTAAIGHADQAIAQFDAAGSGFVEFRVGPNPGVVAHVVAGLFRWMAGFPVTAVERMDAAIHLAGDLEHPPSVAYALHHANLVDLWRLDALAITKRSEELLDLAEEHDYPVWRALAQVFHGAAAVMSGHVEGGVAEIEEGFLLYNELSTPPIFWPAVLMIRATAHGLAGDVERALELMDEARANLRVEDPLGASMAMAEGDLLLAQASSNAEAAAARFEAAAEMARTRKARMVELEALTRLAAVRRGTTAAPGIRLRLQQLYDTITEGLDSPQLTAARAALAGS